MGGGCSSACGCGDDTHPWKADSLSDTLNTYALLNLTSQVIHFAVYQIQLIGGDRYARALCVQVQPSERRLIPKPPLRMGFVRKGVILGVDRAEPPRLIEKLSWQRQYDDQPSTMNLETQHTLVAFEARAEPGAPVLLHLTNPPGYSLQRLSNPVVSKFKAGKSDFVRSIRAELAGDFPEYRYAGRTATVRYGTELCREEHQFLDRRLHRVRAALCRFLDLDLSDLPLDYIPRIGIAASGGGYRAMIASLGVLIEFEKQGLLDCCTYLAGLSGGGWLLANVMSSPARTLAELKPHLQSRLSKPFYDLETKIALTEFRERLANNAQQTVVDEYSWCLSQHMFQGFQTESDLWNKPRLSEQAQRIDQGQRPFPLYVAVAQAQSQQASDMRWVEMSPHEVGIREDVNSFIPSWALGRKWENGRSIDHATEPSLAMHCATIGAGFTATVDQILQNTVLKDGKLARIVHSFLYDALPDLADSRMFTPALYPNWAHKGPVSNVTQLQITDAGCAFNLPIPPLLRPERKVDCIIALDQSAGREQYESSHLTAAARYAREHKYPFPDISEATRIEGKLQAARQHSTASIKPITVCAGSPKDRVPSVIYMPLLRNTSYHLDFDPREAKFCATWSWVWTAEQVELLSGLAAANAAQSVKQIKQHLRRVIEQKREMLRVENYKIYAAARSGSKPNGKSAAVAPAPVTPQPAASPTATQLPHASPTATSFRSGVSSLAGGGVAGTAAAVAGDDEVVALTPIEGRSRTPSPRLHARKREPVYAASKALEAHVYRSGSVVPAANSPVHRSPAAAAVAVSASSPHRSTAAAAASSPHRSNVGAAAAGSSPPRTVGAVQRSRDSPPSSAARTSKGVWGMAAPAATMSMGHARQMSADGR